MVSSSQALTNLSLYKPLTPVRGVMSPSPTVSSAAPNVVLNVRLAQPSLSPSLGISPAKVIPQGQNAALDAFSTLSH